MLGDDGLFKKAQRAKNVYEEIYTNERIQLLEMELRIEANSNGLNENVVKEVFESNQGDSATVNETENHEYIVVLDNGDKYLVETDGKIIQADIFINNKTELENFRANVNAGNTHEGQIIVLTADIDLEGSELNRNWIPIGNYAENTTLKFCGIFDGRNHKIYNLYNKDIDKNYQGLFGALGNATIKNLGIESGDIVGKVYTCGIGARVVDGVVKYENCFNKANISGSWGVAGIGGGYGEFRHCYNEGDIQITSYVNSTNQGVWSGGITGGCDGVLL